jgi:hypothetical protein
MNIRKIPTCEEAKKQILLVDYVAKLGFQPEKKNGHEWWYLSPFHDEKTASFKVNTRLNAWKDWGGSKDDKGSIIDFGVKYHKCSVSDFLQRLGDMPFTPELKAPKQINKQENEQDKKIVITGVKELFSFPLLNYMEGRRIPAPIARRFCKEVSYQLNGKDYYAIGFKNDAGGYELRNRYIKGASAPKASTFIDNGAKEVTVFEGFFNYLSHMTIHRGNEMPPSNYLILNSTSFFEQQLPLMQAHDKVALFLDNDNTGDKWTSFALSQDKDKFKDERHLYKGYNDLNEWQVKIGHAHKPIIKPKI